MAVLALEPRFLRGSEPQLLRRNTRSNHVSIRAMLQLLIPAGIEYIK
jgi:hypothetical protein